MLTLLSAKSETSFSAGVCVISISLGVMSCFGIPVTFKGNLDGTSGTGGSTAAIVASRCFCLSAATSCHVAPDAIVIVTFDMVFGVWIRQEEKIDI